MKRKIKNGLEKIKKTKKQKRNSRKACCLYCEQIKKNGLDVYLPIYFSMTTVKLRLVTGPHYVKSRKL